jgi:hypothetical protein
VLLDDGDEQLLALEGDDRVRRAEGDEHRSQGIGRDQAEVLRDLGLGDPDIANVVFAAAARSFFTKVLGGLGVQADAELGDTFTRRSARR